MSTANPTRRRLLLRAAAWPIGSALAAAGLSACAQQTPVRLAVLGGLTGPVSDLGVAMRDGVLLAVELARAAGRAVELLEFDDAQNPNKLPEVALHMASAQVAAVVGPVTSNIAQAWIPLAQQHGLLTVSPAATSDDFSGLDDQFFRVSASTSEYATQSAAFAVQRLGWRRLALIRDDSNAVFTRSWAELFVQRAHALGATVAEPVVYRGPLTPLQAQTLVQQALAQQPEALVLVANANDAALLAQLARQLQPATALFAAEWASSRQLIVRGGRAVEGMLVAQFVDRNNRSEAYLLFLQRFEQRFRRSPEFAEVVAYDAAQVLLHGLAQQAPDETLKATLLRVRTFPGLQDAITFDDYGDSQRPMVMSEIRNGRFITLGA